ILIGAGASICGAAAVMATQAVVRARAETASVAIATVVVFGTLSMFLYPALYPVLGLSEHAYGVYVGSTVHEVAQVVAAGESVGQWAAATAVIEKMWRVMLLAPFLLVLGLGSGAGGGESGRRARDAIPWFAVAFIGAAVLNSLGVLPSAIVDALAALATPLLAIAMAALGLRTRFDSIREAGAGPLKLGMVLCAFLVVGGYVLNVALARLLSWAAVTGGGAGGAQSSGATSLTTLEKSSPPRPAARLRTYRVRASSPSGMVAPTPMAASTARPGSLSIRSLPKPPVWPREAGADSITP